MKSFFYTILTVFLLTFSVTAQTSSTKNDVLHVEVEGGKTLDLKPTDLANLKRKEVRAKDHNGKETVYEGIELREILQLADVKFGKEFDRINLTRYLIVEAADKYHVTFALAEIDAGFTDKIVLLADKNDGKPLDEKNGYWQIIVPDDKKYNRWVRQVIKLTIKTVDFSGNSNLKVNKLNDEDAIRAIIFKKILEPWRLNSDKNLKAYYLSIDEGKDPSELLLKEFTGFNVSIKTVSECVLSPDNGTVLNRNTFLNEHIEEAGVLFRISKLDWKSKDKVKVSAGSRRGSIAGDGCDYTLKEKNGKWEIISTEKCFSNYKKV